MQIAKINEVRKHKNKIIDAQVKKGMADIEKMKIISKYYL